MDVSDKKGFIYSIIESSAHSPLISKMMHEIQKVKAFLFSHWN